MSIKKNKKTVSFEVQLQSINLLNFYEHDYSKYGLTTEDIKSLKLEFDVGLKIDKDEENISILVNINYNKKKDNQRRNELFGINTEHIFKFHNFKNIFPSTPDGGVKIPDDLMKDLLGISLNDTRGMLLVQVNNPAYKTKVLPLINISDLLKELQKKSERRE